MKKDDNLITVRFYMPKEYIPILKEALGIRKEVPYSAAGLVKLLVEYAVQKKVSIDLDKELGRVE